MRRFAWPGVVVVLVGCGDPPVHEDGEACAGAPAPREADRRKPVVPPPGYTKAPEADRAFAVLDAALERVWELPDPRDGLAEIIRTANEVDPVRTCDRLWAVSVRLGKLKLPPARRVVCASFAVAVAPHAPDLRNDLLRRAVADARRALADPGLWKAPAKKPEGVPFVEPQKALDQERQVLEFQVRLWEAVLEGEEAGVAGGILDRLLADAKSKGHLGGCTMTPYSYFVEEGLANLDADLFLALAARLWDKKTVAETCGSRAYSRWLDRQKDAFTEAYVRHAVKNGVTRPDVVRLFARFDPARARNLPEPTRLGHPTPAGPAGKPWVPPDDLKALLADPVRAAEADRHLWELAQHTAQWGPADHAVDILNHARSPQRFVYTAPWVARALIRRAEID